MKKILLSVFCLFALAFSVTSQESVDSVRQSIKDRGISLRMSYDDYKSLYNPRDYVHQDFDPYSPVGSGVASFFIPGLGQMINGEAGRGFAMLAGDFGLVLAGVLVAGLWTEPVGGDRYTTTTGGKICSSCCFAGALGITVWSICDAVQMAKIKNLYARDCRMLSVLPCDIKLVPSLTAVSTPQNFQYVPSMTLAVRF